MADQQAEIQHRRFQEISTNSEMDLLVRDKAAGLTGRFMNWEKWPGEFRTQISEETASLVEKAVAGDEASQKVLDRTKELLDERKVDGSKLPNLNWHPEVEEA